MADKFAAKRIADKLTIETEWVRAENNSSPERVTAAAIVISLDDVSLTDAYDSFQQKVSKFAQLSAYNLAEWLAWNWWRIRWEPLKATSDWRLSHRLSSIGGGYVWPNICIYSDGQQLIVDTHATEPRSSEPLRYVKNDFRELRAKGFESGVDTFINFVCDRLRDTGVKNTNLESIWRDVVSERADKQISAQRTLEAILGFDPDEADPGLIRRLIGDSSVLGDLGVQELAATSTGRPPPSKDEISDWANSFGIKRDPRNAVKLIDRSEESLPENVEAWRRGKTAARALRKQIGLGERSIPTNELLEMIGSATTQIQKFKGGSPFSFELDENVAESKVVLRETEYETSNRFDLARLIGDNVAKQNARGRFAPITSSYTYRQKMQRAFAAEFLSPFYLIDRMMEGEYYDDAYVEKAASHFEVSPLLVKASLANHGRIDRHDVWVS